MLLGAAVCFSVAWYLHFVSPPIPERECTLPPEGEIWMGLMQSMGDDINKAWESFVRGALASFFFVIGLFLVLKNFFP